MKKIPLTQGKHTIVDDEDYDFLIQKKWQYLNTRGGGYAIHRSKNKTILMHRLLNNTPESMFTDHKNGNGLDNRKSNLRTTNRSGNSSNVKILKNNRTGYKGVSWHKASNKYRATIQVNNKPIHLGTYNSAIQAAKAYNEAAIKYFGEFAKLNVI